VRAQLPGLGIDDLELLFHAKREPVHGGNLLQSTVFSRQSSVDSLQSAVGSCPVE
jgi:hypothetical protein